VKTKLLTLYLLLTLVVLFLILLFFNDLFLEYKISFSLIFISTFIYLIIQQLRSIEDTKKILYITKKMQEYLKDKPLPTFYEKLYDSNLQNFINLTNHTITYLHHKIENKKKFNANIAHEIRKPLTVIRNDIEINFFNKQTPVIKNILNKVQELEDISKQLLLLSNENPENIKKSMTRVFLHEIIQTAIESKKEYAKQKKITIEENISIVISMHANPVLLKFAITNLVDNAIKYSNLNGCIGITLRKKSNYVYCIIKDNGFGITKEDKRLIMHPFYRGKIDQENIEGYGIGLALAYSIFEIHHIDLKINQGTLILLKIPF